MSAALSDARALAAEFWQRMNSNDWSAAADLFCDDIELVWPQSGEFIRSREAFVAVNAEYPASGRWTFSTRSLIGEGTRAVTETLVSDGVIRAVAITFFEVEAGRIRSMREFWPDSYPAPEWRRRWVST
ncbi:MAG: nuclear transport factor 2 family protein [Rhizobiaceae bacterium]